MSISSTAATEHQVAETLRSIAGPIFAAVWMETKQKTELVVHASAARGQRELRLNIISALNSIGVASVKVNFHPVSSLLSPKSLERLVAKFAGSKIVYDPTQSLSRAKALVEASHAVRTALSERIRGLYYAPRLRTYYVTLESSRVVVGDKVKVSELASIEQAVLTAVSGAFCGETAECPAVRVGFGLPAASLVPVDQKSVMGWNARVAGAVKRYWKPITVAALFGFGATAARAGEPAVAEPNLKVSGTFGDVIDDYTWQVQGQFTAPIGQTMGFAVEAGGGAVDGHDYYGAAGHLFMRDPDTYLLGVFGGYAESSDFAIDVARAGVEGEFYLSSLTIAATAGYQFSSAIGDSAFGSIDLRWYVTNNFYLSGGGSIEDDRAYAKVGTEWQPGFAALPGLAFNAQGVWGEDDYHSIMGGLTYYFGVPASLKDRHRKYDPDSALFGLFQSVQQEQSRLCAYYGTNC
ncbi:MAG: hypothetical protein SGI91_02570 [Alphaproteobacteria bacterium]|jgi:hypothetical protein|nr:hypothetical protein [Alphaproteobacteria bacterium]